MQHTSASHPLKCVYCITPYVREFFLFCILFCTKCNIHFFNIFKIPVILTSDSGKAIDEAVEYCIQNDILREFLEKHRRKMKNMCLTEFDEERYGQLMREEGWKDGHAKGIEQGKAEGQLHGIIETCEEMAVPIKDTIAMISKRLGVSLEDAQALYEQYKTQN